MSIFGPGYRILGKAGPLSATGEVGLNEKGLGWYCLVFGFSCNELVFKVALSVKHFILNASSSGGLS